MNIEIEAKLRVDSLPKVVRKLKAAGAEFLRRVLQTDSYFDDAKSSLRKSDSALRIRRQRVNRREQVKITFKGPKQKGKFKHRKEIQFELADTRSVEMLLAELGYKKALVLQKKRRLWRLDNCLVALDTLPLLGDFVEIEGPSERKIARVQEKLGLADLPHMPESYTQLIRNELRRLKRKDKDILF